MRIVLPGALPDPRDARELLPHFVKSAPSLVSWLEQSHATRIVADPAQTYCTAWEYWQLLQFGFKTDHDQVSSAGLGPVYANTLDIPDQEPIWLVELTHLSPSRDGAVLIPAAELALAPEHSSALLQSAQSLLDNTGFTIHPCTTTHWRIQLPNDYTPSCATPELVSTSTVNDWWKQDLDGRPWRRLANELQMLWFDHPVNQARYEHGLIPVNNVWLFGGASRSQFDIKPDAPLHNTEVDQRLLKSMISQDWGNWLQHISELDDELKSSLNRYSEIVMTGHDQIVTFSTKKRFWASLLPGTKQSWKKWWSPQH